MNVGSYKYSIVLYLFFISTFHFQNFNKPIAIVPDFQVNENGGYNYSSQTDPKIASDCEGNFVVVWEDDRNALKEIYFQYFSSSAIPIKQNIKIVDNISPSTISKFPKVLMLNDGSFIIIWFQLSNSNYEICFNHYSKELEQIGNTIKFEIGNLYSAESQIFMNDSGKILIAWMEYNADESKSIFAQMFSSDFTAIGKRILLKNETENLYIGSYSISLDNHNNFIFAWKEWKSGLPKLLIQRFSELGEKIGIEVNVIDNNAGNTNPCAITIANDSSGNFITTWFDSRNSIYSVDVYAQRFNKEGEKIGNNFKVNTSDSYGSYTIEIYFSDLNEYLITWTQHSGDFKNNVWYQRLDKNGNLIGNNIKVNSIQDSTNNIMPTIASDCLGNCFVAWVKEENLSGHYNFDVYCKSFDVNNKQLCEEIKVNDDDGIPVVEQFSPDIAVSQNGNFIICWHDFRNNSEIEIYAQRFLNDGSFIGNNFKVSNKKSYNYSSPKISITPNENFVIVWIQNPLSQNPNDFPKTQIIGQFYNSKGEAIDSNIIISEFPLNSRNDIGVISAIGLENYIISWRTADDSTNNIKIYYQLFSNSGIAQSDKILFDDDINFEDQFVPSISVFPNNNFIISWLALDKKDSTETLFAQIFSADCNRIGEKYKISSSDKRLYITGNKVAVNSDGSFKIYWVEADAINQKRYLKFQKFTSEGNIQDSVKTLEVDDSIFEPNAIDENGNFIILDLQEIDLHNYIYYAQRFDNDGNKLDSNFKLINHGNTSSGGFNIEIKNSRIYSTWTESQNDNDSDVWANILDWDNPTSIKTEESSVLPLKSELSQNYPNPFNPTTTIKYSIPIDEKRQTLNVKNRIKNVETGYIPSVRLVIYDILGSEVKTLVNQKQKPGNYEVEFDGGNLPSGVYFYRLQAGDFIKTKKIILLK